MIKFSPGAWISPLKSVDFLVYYNSICIYFDPLLCKMKEEDACHA